MVRVLIRIVPLLHSCSRKLWPYGSNTHQWPLTQVLHLLVRMLECSSHWEQTRLLTCCATSELTPCYMLGRASAQPDHRILPSSGCGLSLQAVCVLNCLTGASLLSSGTRHYLF